MNFDNKELFIDKKLGDVVYTVSEKGIMEHKVTSIENTRSGYYFTIGDIRFKFEKADSIIKPLDGNIYSDKSDAKEALYEERNKYMKQLHKEMIDAINRYEKMSSILRVYQDISYTDEEWEEMLKGGEE